MYEYAEERYMRDPEFHNLVDTIFGLIHNKTFTPTEVREAAMLAILKEERENPRPVMIPIKDQN